MTRHAVYFAPRSDHPLWVAGCSWLGRDPERGRSTKVGARRAEPRRYGFHATLKPPFVLADGVDEALLSARLEAFAATHASFDMPALHVAMLGDFLALRPVPPDAAVALGPLQSLADDAVRRLDHLRRRPGTSEIARLQAPGLSPTQRANVELWGWPHVFGHWRFHMTLTDGLPRGDSGEALHRALTAEADAHFAVALEAPLRCDGVALFVEDAPGADFRLVRRFPFGR